MVASAHRAGGDGKARSPRSARVLLLYPPLQFELGEVAKPDGSLGPAYLAGALRRAGVEVAILDASVGADRDPLGETFYRAQPTPRGLYRVGLLPDRLLEEAADWDVIGVSSIFTPQTSMVLDTIRTIKGAFPEKLVVAGGVNARSLAPRFFDAGTDVICLAEGEQTIVDLIRHLERGDRHFDGVCGIDRVRRLQTGADGRAARAEVGASRPGSSPGGRSREARWPPCRA